MLYVIIYKSRCVISGYVYGFSFWIKKFLTLTKKRGLVFKSSDLLSYLYGLTYSTDFIYIFINASATYVWLFFFNSIFFRLLLVCFILWV